MRLRRGEVIKRCEVGLVSRNVESYANMYMYCIGLGGFVESIEVLVRKGNETSKQAYMPYRQAYMSHPQAYLPHGQT